MTQVEGSAELKSLKDTDHLVLIVVSLPLLAMRYQLPNGQVSALSQLAEYISDESKHRFEKYR